MSSSRESCEAFPPKPVAVDRRGGAAHPVRAAVPRVVGRVRRDRDQPDGHLHHRRAGQGDHARSTGRPADQGDPQARRPLRPARGHRPLARRHPGARSSDEIQKQIDKGTIDADAYNVKISHPSLLGQIVTTLLPFVLIVLIFLFLMNQVQGGGGRGVMQFAKSRAKLITKDMPKTTFGDVAGGDEAVEELGEIKEFLQEPAKFQAVGAKIPKGVLLYGPPGTGKTLLARAVAGEAGVPFYSISGSDFVEMFVGVGASRVRDLFEQAKENAPGHRLHRRDRRRRPPPRRRHGRRSRRARADPEPAAGRDGRLRRPRRRHPDRRHQPARRARPRAAAPGPLRPADPGRRPRPGRPAPDPPGPRARQAARAGRRPARRSPGVRRASPAPTWRTSSTRPRC